MTNGHLHESDERREQESDQSGGDDRPGPKVKRPSDARHGPQPEEVRAEQDRRDDCREQAERPRPPDRRIEPGEELVFLQSVTGE